MITVRLEPAPPFDDEGNPEHWIVVNSLNKETRRFARSAKRLALAYVTEFNIASFEADRRMRGALSSRSAGDKAVGKEPTERA